MKANGWRARVPGAIDSALGIVTTVFGILVILGVIYLLIWLIDAITG